MGDRPSTKTLRRRLERRRDELTALREGAHRDLEELEAPSVELEEAGQKQHLAQGLERRGVQERNELEAIAAALGRMDAGSYGVCTSCGGPIGPRRLEAIPWTPHCRTCAEAEEATAAAASTPAPEATAGAGTQLPERPGKTAEQVVAQGRDVQDDPWGVERPEGTPMNPPDELIPEK